MTYHVEAVPIISVLTAALAAPQEYVDAAYDSLCRQEGPSWEWILQLDGERPEDTRISKDIRVDPRVKIESNGRQLGVASTRNRALVRSRSELVQNLDVDDQLFEGALGAGAEALHGKPDLAFAFGRTVHLAPDGSYVHKWAERVAFAPGEIPAGALPDHWLRTGEDGIPISPVIWRRSQLFAHGGWAALTGLEDTCLVLAASSISPCWYIDMDTQLYREHGGQVTASRGFSRDREANVTFMRERVRGLGALCGSAQRLSSKGSCPSVGLQE
jgi:glycosyltransferase involved in cell wall biosynthesis